MSGHSHAKTVKRVKDAHDAARGRIFSKLARMISVAVKEGADPAMNPRLRQALDEAKSVNMPKENIGRAIKRGTGEIEGAKLEEVSYEAFGPGKTAIIIEGITDNKNRTLSEIKQILQRHGGKLAEAGSVKWLFERKGIITIQITLVRPDGSRTNPAEKRDEYTNKEELELKAIEAGAEDIFWHKNENVLDIYTAPNDLNKTKENLESGGLKIDSAGLDWVAKKEIEVSEKDKENLEKLFEELDDSDAVQDIYSNAKI